MPDTLQRKTQQFDLYRYLRVVWRRKWLLIIPLAVCLPVAVWVAYIYPTEYESKATLEIQDNRPLAEAGTVRPRRYSVDYAIMSVRTRALGYNTIREIVLSRRVDFGREIDPDDRRQLDRLYREVVRRTRVKALGRQHIQISHRSTNPERNAALVNELVKKFVGEDRRLAQEQAKQDVEYYRQKLDAAKAVLTEVDNQLRDFAQNNPWLHDDIGELHRDLKDAEAEEEAVQQEIAELEATLEDIKKALAKEDPEITVVNDVEPSEEIKALRQQAQAAEAYFREIDAKYRPTHSRWQDARRRYEQAAAELKAKDQGDLTEEQTVDNPKYAELQQKAFIVEKTLDKLNRRKLDANKKVSELYLLYRKAPELITERKRLNEQRAAAQEVVGDLGKHYRAAEKNLQRLMTEAYSTKFRVMEYARDDRTPVKSTKLKIVALGVMVGLMTGVGLIVLIEYLDQTFKTIDDAREVLGIPALGVIPAIYTPRDHRRRLWFRVLAVSSAVFVVGVAVTLYLAVPAVPEMLREHVWPAFQEMMQTF